MASHGKLAFQLHRNGMHDREVSISLVVIPYPMCPYIIGRDVWDFFYYCYYYYYYYYYYG